MAEQQPRPRSPIEENIDFLARILTAEFLEDRVANAVARSGHEPEWEKARQLEGDFPECRALVTLRVAELPLLLSQHTGLDGWSI